MSFWKKKKYCEYCGSVKNADGNCPNQKCIAYKASSTTTSGTQTTTSTTTTTTKEG